MATDTLRPTGDDTLDGSLQFSTGTTAWDLIDDDPDSASNADYVFAVNSATTSWIKLSPTGGFGGLFNFEAMTAATINYRYEASGFNGDTWGIYWQVYAADQTTAYTSEVGNTGTADAGPTTTSGATITAAGEAATKADWATAQIRLRTTFSQDMGADGGEMRFHAVEINVTYDELEAKVDVPTRLATASRAKTITAALAQDQWGKYLVPQLPWIKPVQRGVNVVVPGTYARRPTFSPDGRFLAMPHNTSPYLDLYAVVGASFAKLADPATSPTGDGFAATFSPDGRFLAVAHLTTPYITIYERENTTFTKLTNPGTLPASTGRGAAFSPDGRFLAVAHATTPFVTIYERSGTTFTKLTNPGTLPTGTGNGVTWSPDGRFLAVGHDTSPYITIYERENTTFTKLTNPGTLPAGDVDAVAFSPDGRYLLVRNQEWYRRDDDTFTKLTTPSLTVSGTDTMCWRADGRYFVACGVGGPRSALYRRDGETLTRLSLPTANLGLGAGAAWSPDGRFVVCTFGNITPATIIILETSGLNPTEGLLWMEHPGER